MALWALGSIQFMPTPIEIADSLEAELRDAFLAMVDVVAQSVPPAQLEAWLEARDFPAIVHAFERAIATHVTISATPLAQVYQDLFVQSLLSTVPRTIVPSAFRLVSQAVLDRINTSAAKLVTRVGQDSVLAIRTIIEEGYLEGIGAPAMGRLIRAQVGLLPQHSIAVGRYAAGLKAAHIPEPEMTNLVETYSRRLKAYRAENIARTETISATHAGQLQGWLEMVQRGVLQPRRTRVVWVVTDDDRLCPWCAPMDGQEVELGQMFVATEKGFPLGKPEARGPGSKRVDRTTLRPDPRSQPRDEYGRFTRLRKRDTRDYLDNKLVPLATQIVVPHPPLHPQCRCTMKLRFID